MIQNFKFKKFLPYLVAVAFFAVLSLAYMAPVLSGKQLIQSDVTQAHAGQSEIFKYNKETPGEYIGWTNSMFGGMPAYTVGGDYSKGIFTHVQKVVFYLLGVQGTYIFLYLLGAFVLCLSLGMGLFPSVFSAIAYAFFSYNIMIIEAGHLAKVYALAFVPIMIGGMILGYRKNPWLGAVIFSFGLGLEVNANHLQITYYSIFIIAILASVELFFSIKDSKLPRFLLSSVLFLVLGVLVIGTSTSKLWTTYAFQKETIRGGSELSAKPSDIQAAKIGLEKEYAFEWSYGKLESLTFLIPNFSGGSRGELDDKSEVFKNLSTLGIDRGQALGFANSLSTYWGDQRFVSGGTYSGAIVCFLFVLSLFFVGRRNIFIFLSAGLLCLFIGWGKNFSLFNYAMFDYFPLFNKFRAVSMSLSLFQLCIAVLAGLGLHHIISEKPTWAQFKTPFLVSLALTAGLCLAFALVPSFFDFVGAGDEDLKAGLKQSFGENTQAINSVYSALLEDRASLLSSDSWRSLIFILLSATMLLLWVKGIIKVKNVVMGVIVLLCLIDLWTVDKRYLNKDDFQRPAPTRMDQFTASASDLQILQDKSLHYRMIDLTVNPFSNAMASAFHKSMGGYSATRLRRFGDVLDYQISKNNMAVLDMFNTKYFITNGQNNTPTVQLNVNALGNAWFVKNVKLVTGADQEMKALDSLKPKETVLVDRIFEKTLAGKMTSTDLSGSVELVKYHPNRLNYTFNSTKDQIVVFSEVFYNGNVDWISKIDGKKVDHFRANYILRGLVVPAGKHEIEFSFEPVTVIQGGKYDKIFSYSWILLVLGCLFISFKKSNG